MGNSRSKREDSKYDDEDLSYEEDENALQYLELHLTRLIAYAESADASLQREVAERLANEAVKPERQVQIVDLGGLRLLIPLTRSADGEVQRLAAHALANLSVNAMKRLFRMRAAAWSAVATQAELRTRGCLVCQCGDRAWDRPAETGEEGRSRWPSTRCQRRPHVPHVPRCAKAAGDHAASADRTSRAAPEPRVTTRCPA